LLAGDAGTTQLCVCGAYMFQSAPAIAGGRCISVAAKRFSVDSFNPRPPLLAGDAEVIAARDSFV